MTKNNFFEIIKGKLSYIGKYGKILVFVIFILYALYIFLFTTEIFSTLEQKISMDSINETYPIISIRRDYLVKIDNFFRAREENSAKYSQMFIGKDPFLSYDSLPKEPVQNESAVNNEVVLPKM